MTTRILISDQAVRSATAMGRSARLRAFDLTLAVLLLVALSPVLLLRGLVALIAHGRLFTLLPRLGRGHRLYRQIGFAGTGVGSGLPVLFNVIAGDLGFVGPRARLPEEMDGRTPQGANVVPRPGLVSTHAVRRQAGIAFEDERFHDRLDIYRLSVSHSVALLVRFALVRLIGGASAVGEMAATVSLFGVPVANASMEETVGWLLARLRSRHATNCFFVNADCFNIAARDTAYRACLLEADRVLPDGLGVAIAGRMLGTPFAENVNGTDLLPHLCRALAASGDGLFLLGARPGVAEDAARTLAVLAPGLRIAGTCNGYFTAADEEDVVAHINGSGAKVLVVAMGAPRQEVWLQRNRHRLIPPVCLGVGGCLDFHAHRVSRAPQWLREMRMEWVWRLLQEPGRMWRRYLIGNGVFLMRLAVHVRSVRRARKGDAA
ncbi:sugar transferase (plasmid) [Azospirillum baldaniorum]|uniref:Bacterial sugar transferase/glycosyl transferase, WecB/TagA/CpsF family protein n=1 Tax=Azospirillum baldaniorum TaxID=1064539 RepID=A0A9P1JYI6_9PROT|nr:WecB/TagA/CpsF family glycosyltransferase [Azospirillum baldaniorum]AWJ93124.1 sugar transferase [Azospirillum baldaniorum]TWA76106.1 N-acetylglucosaminyldiphosphoundecaprenol N-acetyl-beta-D-mannosaminyltransferase [Azospirillum brasilense]CCD02269.1 bacterial sugar transferase/glycosyl transferase, WecB/TagA/CpsF family protein [Azospirillum baldaniorum]